jgi:mucin-2
VSARLFLRVLSPSSLPWTHTCPPAIPCHNDTYTMKTRPPTPPASPPPPLSTYHLGTKGTDTSLSLHTHSIHLPPPPTHHHPPTRPPPTYLLSTKGTDTSLSRHSTHTHIPPDPKGTRRVSKSLHTNSIHPPTHPAPPPPPHPHLPPKHKGHRHIVSLHTHSIAPPPNPPTPTPHSPPTS